LEKAVKTGISSSSSASRGKGEKAANPVILNSVELFDYCGIDLVIPYQYLSIIIIIDIIIIMN